MSERNRDIVAAHEAGASIAQLAHRYNLACISVKYIVRAERHRRDVCVDPYYRVLRGEKA